MRLWKSSYTRLNADSHNVPAPKRNLCYAVFALITFFSLSTAYYVSDLSRPWLPNGTSLWGYLSRIDKESRLAMQRPSWGALKSQGAKASFRDDLRDDKHYLMSFVSGGWNNQVIAVFNQLYLAHLTRRIAILPAFSAHSYHLGYQAHDVAVSEIFDLNGLCAVLEDTPIVELHELKTTQWEPQRLKGIRYDGEFPQYSSKQTASDDSGLTQGDPVPLEIGDMILPEQPHDENIGCWSFEGSQGHLSGGSHPGQIKSISSPLPIEIYSKNSAGGVNIWNPQILEAAQLIMPGRPHPLPPSSLEILHNNSFEIPTTLPEDHVACVDSMYWFVEQGPRYDLHGEWKAGQGVWNRIGKHMRFQPGIEAIKDIFLRKELGVPHHLPVPPYMTIHIRRTDFAPSWKELTPRHYAHAAQQVLESVRSHRGIVIRDIIVATDETDPLWLEDLRQYGMRVINHTESRTVERFGHWLPTIIDSAIMSGSTGFLGVTSSTMSILAYRRVIDWNIGVARMIELFHKVPEDWEWDWKP